MKKINIFISSFIGFILIGAATVASILIKKTEIKIINNNSLVIKNIDKKELENLESIIYNKNKFIIWIDELKFKENFETIFENSLKKTYTTTDEFDIQINYYYLTITDLYVEASYKQNFSNKYQTEKFNIFIE